MQWQLNKNNIQQMLAGYSTAELESLVAKHPYFAQAHVLLAKKYQQETNPKFDKQLQLAVLYTNNRELLFEIFNDKGETSSIQISQPAITFTETILAEPAEEVREEENLVTPTEDTQSADPIPETVFLSEEKPAPANELPDETNVLQNQLHSFDEWLHVFADITTTVKPEKTSETETLQNDDELDRLIKENTASAYLHELMEEETHYSRGLEKFIEEQIEKHKAQTIKQPLNDNEIAPELITETMAKIYEMQKKYSKAIKAYEVLTLKYPEKSDLFAVRIIQLKNFQ
jgi:hypothetical protein